DAAASLGPLRREMETRSGEGRRNLSAIACRLPPSPAGRPRVSFIVEDVTERKQLESRLRVTDRMASLGPLAAGKAHEIHNPLTHTPGTLGSAISELGHLELSVRARLEEPLRDAYDGAERVQRMVRDLKLVSRPDDERVDSVDVREVLDSAIKVVHNEIR